MVDGNGKGLDAVLAGGYELEFEETFGGDDLDTSRWVPYYLPQWSSRDLAAARYELVDGQLHLLIEAEQPPWCPDLDGPIRVSNLQTGLYAGPLGSPIGQHRFNREAVVREEQPELRLYTPRYGVFVLRARALDDPDCMVALWMIGFEDAPERSAEICVCEIFGRNIFDDSVLVGMGLHPFGDPSIRDDFVEVSVDVDAREFHDYAIQWTPSEVVFFVDGDPVRTVRQSPDYPMQLMLNIYKFGDVADPPESYPKRFIVDSFRGYRPMR